MNRRLQHENRNIAMKKIFLFSLLISFLQSNGATLKGKILPFVKGTTYVLTLINYDTRKDSVIKKIETDDKGNFTIQINNKEPFVYSFGTDKKVYLHLLIKPKDIIELSIDNDKIVGKGSQDTQYLVDYEAFRIGIFKKWLKPVYDSSAAAEKSGNKEKLEYWNKQQTYASDNYKAELSKWVSQSFFLRSPAAIHHSLRWHPDNDIVLMDSLVAIYKRNYPNISLTKQIEAKVTRTKRTAFGAKAPDFISSDQNGTAFELYSIAGRYILLDFWASWCPPCRQESPTLVRLFNQYKDRGFTIVSVSVDDKKDKWIEAIQKDGLVWTNVSEVNGWKSPSATLYNVSAIPQSFLLDKDGKIIAKNLRGTDLENKLAELLGK